MDFSIDMNNYTEQGTIFNRIAIRGIVIKENQILMVKSKYGDYKFPGGGIEGNETHEETLIREMV